MKHRIWKYTFEIADSFFLSLPAGARILHAECQQGAPTLWALVDPDAELRARKFRIIGTGHPIDQKGLTHIATFQQQPFVWHLFEEA